jgi:two-component system cell cycle response regulator DivK
VTVKILVVEDNELNSDMLSQRLKRKGYEIILAVNGEEAIQLAKKSLPHLILMDMGLPVMDGWEATRQLKADPLTQPIPVIALTAHTDPEERRQALAAGCDDYESKPIDFTQLLEKIDKFLEKH